MILNRGEGGKFLLPADGWYHLAKFGDYPGEQEMPDGTTREVIQRITNRGVDKMIAHFNREKSEPSFTGLLLDYEHFSHNLEKSSAAAGWIVDLEKRETGLWAKIDPTEDGERDLTSGKYRMISSVWDGPEVETGVIEPTVLFDAGLTNKPKLTGLVPLTAPLKNRAGRIPATIENMNYTPATIAAMVAALGLPAESTDAQITTALSGATVILNRGKDYPALETKYNDLLGSVADSDLDEFGIKDEEERKQFRPMLIANRAGTRALLARGKAAKAERPAPIHNRNVSGPKPITDDETVTAAQEKRANKISNRARAITQASPGLSMTAAYQQATSEVDGESAE